MISSDQLLFFRDEMQKIAAMPQPAAPQEPKKKNIVTRHMGKGTLALGVLGGLAALKNPATAGKYLKQMKDVAVRPGVALKRGFRSGSSNVMKGPGYSEAASKRVSMYKDVLQSASEGRRQSYRALEDVAAGRNTLRARGFGSAGSQTSRGGQQLKMSKDLSRRVTETQKALARGDTVDEKVLRGLYTEVQQAGKGLDMKKGLSYYAPGERGAFLALGGGLGGTAGLETHDPETGRKRGIAERVARGTVGAAVGTMATPLFMGRGAGLSSKSFLTGKKAKGFVQGLASQKGIIPLAGSTAVLGAGGIAGDVAGGGGAIVDKAFGQK